jgi:hypothetical protein
MLENNSDLAEKTTCKPYLLNSTYKILKKCHNLAKNTYKMQSSETAKVNQNKSKFENMGNTYKIIKNDNIYRP